MTEQMPDAPAAGLDAAIELSGRFEVNVSLRIARGETAVIVGPNGAGKSTIARALAGHRPVDRGHVIVDGRRMDDPNRAVFLPPHERGIGVVFQDSLLFPHLSVRENIGFSGRSTGPAEVDDWLARVGLSAQADARPGQLSGGQARRAAIARAFIGSPPLVILDEPFAGLDVESTVAVRTIVREQLASHASTQILITHDPVEAAALADRIIVVEDGQVTQTGDPRSIRTKPRTPYVADFVGLNYLEGDAKSGVVTVGQATAAVEIATSDRSLQGPTRLTFAPSAIALYREAPAGSPRNSWPAVVGQVHEVGNLVRVSLDQPTHLLVDVTPGAAAELRIESGQTLWAVLKATSISAEPIA